MNIKKLKAIFTLESIIGRNSRKRGMNVSELEKMGRNLMDIALQYTHPNFEGMYPDWGAVCNIGEELVRMSDQPQLNENQQVVLKWLKAKFTSIRKSNPIGVVYLVHFANQKTTPEHTEMWMAYRELTKHQEAQVLQAFSQWALEQEEE